MTTRRVLASAERIGFPVEHALRFDVPASRPGYAVCANCGKEVSVEEWASGAVCEGVRQT